MKPIMIVLGAAGFAAVLYFNSQYDVMSNNFIYLVLGIAGIALASKYAQDNGLVQRDKQKEIDEVQALEEVQKFLEQRKGKNKLYLDDGSYYEDTMPIYENGKKNRYYAIVGWCMNDRGSKGVYKSRVIWNMTENTLKKHDPEVTKSFGKEVQTNPFAEVDKFVDNQGKSAVKREKDSSPEIQQVFSQRPEKQDEGEDNR